MAVQHTAMHEPGCEPVSAYAPFRLDQTKSPSQPRGFLLGLFGTKDKPSHVMVVNLDYSTAVNTTLTGPGELETFDPATSQWTPLKKPEAELNLPPGGGRLVRMVATPN
jgi:hypothetical protein